MSEAERERNGGTTITARTHHVGCLSIFVLHGWSLRGTLSLPPTQVSFSLRSSLVSLSLLNAHSPLCVSPSNADSFAPLNTLFFLSPPSSRVTRSEQIVNKALGSLFLLIFFFAVSCFPVHYRENFFLFNGFSDSSLTSSPLLCFFTFNNSAGEAEKAMFPLSGYFLDFVENSTYVKAKDSYLRLRIKTLTLFSSEQRKIGVER